MTAETDESSREAWVASLDAVAALEPEIVVAGNKRADTPDLPENIAASQQYLREVQPHCQRDTIADIVSALLDCTATGTTHASYGTPPAQLPKSAADPYRDR